MNTDLNHAEDQYFWISLDLIWILEFLCNRIWIGFEFDNFVLNFFAIMISVLRSVDYCIYL